MVLLNIDANKCGITTKTDVGTLLYSLTNKPYAVSHIAPVTSIVPTALDSLTYTSFESVSTIEEGIYTASFVYNPEDQRAKMEVKQNGSVLLTRWYLGSNYIKETSSGVTKEYTFIGGDAYSAPVVAIKQSGTTTFYYLLRDHLGSITHIVNASTGSTVYEYSYDAWGRMRNTSTWTDYAPGSEPVLFIAGRGFTGHEHLPWFNLINMNGRVYDPLTGQFLSPDNNVQSPDFTQNLNRYAYCLNNPLKYTDPDGEFFWFPIIAGALIFGGWNVGIHSQNGDIHNLWDGLGYFVQGAAAGAAAGAGWSFGIAGITSSSKLLQIGGGILLGGKAINAISTTASFINDPDNSLKIMMGKAYTDENRSFLGGLWQGISRFTWEGLQTWSGYNYTQLRNTSGKVDEVRYFGGATFAIDENVTRFKKWQGASLGNYINAKIHGGLDEDYPGGWIYSEGGLFWHEYGHTFDSQLYGLSYLLSIGRPSATGAEWTERRANKWAWKYAKRHKYMDEWMYPDEYPSK